MYYMNKTNVYHTTSLIYKARTAFNSNYMLIMFFGWPNCLDQGTYMYM